MLQKLQRLISISTIFLLSLLLIVPQPMTVLATQSNHSEIDIHQAIEKASTFIMNNGVDSEWEAIGLAKAGKEVPGSYEDVLRFNIQDQIIDNEESGRIKITDIERLAIATVAIGLDPRDIEGLDLIELIYNSPDHRNGSDTMTFQGNNGLIYALVALDTKEFEVPDDARWTRQDIIAELLNNQNEDGSWPLNNLFNVPDIDITAMALIALSAYKDYPYVQEAIDDAVSWLSSKQTDDGGFDGGDFVGGITSEAASQAVIGLAANQVDPTSETFTKDGNNLLEHLLSYQNEDGGFRHTNDYDYSDPMATEQALQAIVAYQLYLNGEGSIYDFNSNDEAQPEPPVDEEPPSIVVKGLTEGETVTTSEIEFTVEATDNNDESIAPYVQVNGKELSPIDSGKYVAVLKVGENIIDVTATDEAGNETNLTYNIIYQEIDEVILDKPTEVEKGQHIVVEGSNTELILPDDLPEGTKLIVSDREIAHEGMEMAGDIFTFELIYPEGSTMSEGYTLAMGVKSGVDLEKTGIYYFNDKTEQWQYTDGWGKAENGQITIEVDHFSTYGVFTDNSGPSDIEITIQEITSNQVMLGLSAIDPSGIKEFIIYRDGEKIAVISGNESEFIDTNLSASHSYQYTVKVVDQLGNVSEVDITVTTKDENREEINPEEEEDTSGTDLEKPGSDTDINDISTGEESESEVELTNKLPSTATNTYNYVLIGLLLMVAGVIAFHIRKRSLKESK